MGGHFIQGERRGARGQLPADRLAAAAKPSTRQAIWDAMRACEGAWFTVADIRWVTDRNKRTIATYLECLCAGGVAERATEMRADGSHLFRLIGAPAPEAPRLRKDGAPVVQGGGVENMWRSMRMLAQFSARELAIHSTTPRAKVSENTAKSYCSMLHRAGFLRAVRPSRPGQAAIYRLIRNSGPRPPMIQRVKRVFDPNTNTVWPVDEAPEGLGEKTS